MARTTSDAVIKVLVNDYDGVTDLTTYIDTASLIVDDISICAAAKGQPLSDAKKEMIERWLSAHFYGQSDKPLIAKSTADSSATFAGKTDMYLESTLYGQTAARLDPSGCLAAIAGHPRKTANMFWAGKNPRNQIPAKDRD